MKKFVLGALIILIVLPVMMILCAMAQAALLPLDVGPILF